MTKKEFLQSCWVSIEDRLPPADNNKRVLVWLRLSGEPWIHLAGQVRAHVLAYRAGELPNPDLVPASIITHWMDVPEPKEAA